MFAAPEDPDQRSLSQRSAESLTETCPAVVRYRRFEATAAHVPRELVEEKRRAEVGGELRSVPVAGQFRSASSQAEHVAPPAVVSSLDGRRGLRLILAASSRGLGAGTVKWGLLGIPSHRRFPLERVCGHYRTHRAGADPLLHWEGASSTRCCAGHGTVTDRVASGSRYTIGGDAMLHQVLTAALKTVRRTRAANNCRGLPLHERVGGAMAAVMLIAVAASCAEPADYMEPLDMTLCEGVFSSFGGEDERAQEALLRETVTVCDSREEWEKQYARYRESITLEVPESAAEALESLCPRPEFTSARACGGPTAG